MAGSNENYWATTQLIKNFNGLLGDHQSPSSNTKGTKLMGIHFTRGLKTKKSTNQNSGVRMCIVNSNGEKNNYYGVIEEIWELEYGVVDP